MFSIIKNKIDGIRLFPDNRLIQQINLGIDSFFQKNQFNVNFLTPTFKEFLKVELLYSFLKHCYWSDLKILYDIWVDYLISEFVFTREHAEDLICALINITKSYSKNNIYSCINNEDEFWKYVLISAITCEDLKLLDLELALGNKFNQKILRALKVFDDINSMPEHADSFNCALFLNSIDETIVLYANQLYEQSKINPIIIDLYKLKYILGSYTDQFGIDVLHTLKEQWFFDLLLYIGKHKMVTQGSLEYIFFNSLDKHYPGMKDTNLSYNMWFQLISFLKNKELLIMEQSHTNYKKNKWKLSHISEKITAHAYAIDFLSNKTNDIKSIINLCSEYQKSIISLIKDKDIIYQLIPLVRHLSVESAKVLIQRLWSLDNKKQSYFHIVNIFNTSTNNTLKEFICWLLDNESKNNSDIKLYNTTHMSNLNTTSTHELTSNVI